MAIRNISYTLRCLLAGVALLLPAAAFALPADFYASSSKLKEGKWRKVRVTQEGMHLITTAQLKSMGFSDPERVNVYGYGGRQLSAILDASMPDDLPMQPVVRTDKGIVFFATSTVGWKEGDGNTPFSHYQNYYSTESWYFLSDADCGDTSLPSYDGTAVGDMLTETFTETLLHEQELQHPGNSGSLMYGEDFRTTASRPFKFSLEDAVGDKATLIVAFATKTTSSSSSITVTANGKQLPAMASDVIQPISSDEMMARRTVSIKQIDNPGSSLDINIKYNPGGVVRLACLDYIRLNYERRLSLGSGALVFRSESTDAPTFAIGNADSSVRIWDVTDPARPVDIKYILRDGKALFRSPSGGYRQFVAFRPDDAALATSAAVAVENQDLHSLPVPDMVIVTPKEYISQAQRVAALHEKNDGFRVHVLTPEQIYNEFSSGSQDVTAIRKAMKMWYDRGADDTHRLGYLLIFGRPSYDNRLLSEEVRQNKYTRMPIWQAPDGLTASTSYCTDDYLAFLDDNARQPDMGSAKLCIAVGRFPVKNLTEATSAVDKLINYVDNPEYGDWRNKILVIADDQDNGVHLTQAEWCVDALAESDGGRNMNCEKLYLDSYPIVSTGRGQTYPQARQRLLKVLNEGVNYVDYIGHGSTTQWSHESLWTYSDICGMANKRLPVFTTATCEFGRFDANAICAAEILWLQPASGAIALLTSTRLAYISQNGTFNQKLSAEMFRRDSDGRGRRLGDAVMAGKNAVGGSDTNKLRYNLLGDPAMRLSLPSLTVAVDKINGTDADAPDGITIQARSAVTISGSVLNPDGSVASDFNGLVSPRIYDAEKVVTTYGNGEEGKVMNYNDRTNLLFNGSVEARNGKWELKFVVPLEIENNYSPAKISLYGVSNDGREAHGSFDRFYVYGVDENANGDKTGPKISLIALNSRNFRNGDIVNSSPTLLVELSDESGINISQIGIGHQISAIVDGNKPLPSVADYFTTDPADSRSGKVSYPIEKLEPGEHTLEFTAWDNAGNSSTASIGFTVSDNAVPVIFDVTTDANPATTSVTFTLLHDAAERNVEGTIDVFDLGGARIWSMPVSGETGATATWKLTDGSGARVARGIYLYRATLKSDDGYITTKTKKLAVAAE